MQVKIFNVDEYDDLESAINKWLPSLKEGEEIEDMRIGSNLVIILYGTRVRRSKKTGKGSVICRQCRKRLAEEGMKSCPECLDYQKQYREKKKDEKTSERYLP